MAESARLHGVAERLNTEAGEVFEPLDQRLRDADIEDLRSVLGDEVFSQEFETGRQMSFRQAVDFASSHLPSD